CLTKKALVMTSQQPSVHFDALERVLKGVETPLPEGLVMVDKEGTERSRVRVRWWLDELNKKTL
ncbi:MAG TPA: phosphoesterase, partial [Psychrobacter sp.]|nr:phosphoesterase [Psychrobacter sp.]